MTVETKQFLGFTTKQANEIAAILGIDPDKTTKIILTPGEAVVEGWTEEVELTEDELARHRANVLADWEQEKAVIEAAYSPETKAFIARWKAKNSSEDAN